MTALDEGLKTIAGGYGTGYSVPLREQKAVERILEDGRGNDSDEYPLELRG